jgi:hypothetical protein
MTTMTPSEFHDKILEVVDAIHNCGVKTVDVHGATFETGECGFHVYFVRPPGEDRGDEEEILLDSGSKV